MPWCCGVVLLLALRVRGVELGRVCVMAGCVRCMMLMGDVRCVYDEVCGCECSMFDVVCDVRALCVRVCACECVYVHVCACWLAWCVFVSVYVCVCVAAAAAAAMMMTTRRV